MTQTPLTSELAIYHKTSSASLHTSIHSQPNSSSLKYHWSSHSTPSTILSILAVYLSIQPFSSPLRSSLHTSMDRRLNWLSFMIIHGLKIEIYGGYCWSLEIRFSFCGGGYIWWVSLARLYFILILAVFCWFIEVGGDIAGWTWLFNFNFILIYYLYSYLL